MTLLYSSQAEFILLPCFKPAQQLAQDSCYTHSVGKSAALGPRYIAAAVAYLLHIPESGEQ
jgi:hypothetical protein